MFVPPLDAILPKLLFVNVLYSKIILRPANRLAIRDQHEQNGLEKCLKSQQFEDSIMVDTGGL
jgi:hypothetical protein